MRSVLTVIACAVALLATAASARAQTLTAPGFTTQFPDGWTQARHTFRGLTMHTLMAPGTTVPDFFASIPKPGGIAISISTSSVKTFEKVTHHRAPRSGLQLMDFVGVPTHKHLKTVSKPTRFTLDGSTGVTVTYSYPYKGTQNLQRDVAVRKGHRLVLIELNCRPDLEPSAQPALNTVLAGWHWQ
jgi:hypothetical protein